MKLLMVIQSYSDASARVRALAYRDALGEAGVDSSVAEALPGRSARRALFSQAREADVVFVQRKLFNGWDLLALRRAAKRLIFDFDDAISLKDDISGARRSWTRLGRFRRTAALADAIVAGNRYLADNIPEQHRGKVTVIPSVADTDQYRPDAIRRGSEPPVVGWIGSRSTLPYLEDLAGVLGRVQKATGCRVVAVADQPPGMPGVDLEFHPWAGDKEVDEINAMDVGLMPLPDTPWTRGKCGYKLLLYLACAVPAAASPVGVNSQIVKDNETGILCADEDEWERKLKELVADRELRAALGKRGREHVAQNYSLRMWRHRLVDVVRANTS